MSVKDLKHSHMLVFFEQLRQDIAAKTGLSVTLGIGRSYDKIENLGFSYFEAVNALEYASRIGENHIIHASNINETNRKHTSYPFTEKEDLLLSIRLGDIENTAEHFDHFFVKFREYNSNRIDTLKIRLYEIVGAIVDSAIRGGGQEDDLNELDLFCFCETSKFGDIDQVEIWLKNMALRIAGMIARTRCTRSNAIIEKAKQYIEDKYKESISVEDVAGKIFISPSYFMHIFKEETGVTVGTYLTNIRIRKAKELLLTTDKNVTCIAYEVGFHDSNYFSKVFKDVEGVSPSDYKKRNQV